MNIIKKTFKYGPRIFINNILPHYFVSHPSLSSFYYFLFSGKFEREQHAVLQGKVKHLKEQKSKKSNYYTLVRNIHRIEKGLLMRPRRPVFALDYIEETTNAFLHLNDNSYIKVAQYKWFKDVLTEYFSTTQGHPKIERLATRFQESLKKSEEDILCGNGKSIPYKRIEAEKPDIAYDEFYKLTRYRRSVRWFLKQPVPRHLIDKAILAASQAPSACNRQPFEYFIIDDPDLLKEVVKLPMGIKGYEKGIPMLIVIVGNLDAYFDERDRHVIYIDASLANMTMMYALETMGLSSCSINWPDMEGLERKMERLLKLKKHQRPLMCMAVGYPDPEGMVAFSEKRNLDQLRKYNLTNS
ncbi:nitroreductase [Flammeovirgaceae bacterium 311]|nr:nitroreductase [Flammeovirgaceae bacterium 311]